MQRRTADFLTSAVFLVSLALLLINDFVLKRLTPGTLSGKLSDFVGPIVAALIVVAALEFLARRGGRDRWARPSWFLATACLVVLAFSFVKLTTVGSLAYGAVNDALMTAVQWVVSPLGWEVDTRLPLVVKDPLDVLIAAASIPLVAWLGLRWRGDRATTHAA